MAAVTASSELRPPAGRALLGRLLDALREASEDDPARQAAGAGQAARLARSAVAVAGAPAGGRGALLLAEAEALDALTERGAVEAARRVARRLQGEAIALLGAMDAAAPGGRDDPAG